MVAQQSAITSTFFYNHVKAMGIVKLLGWYETYRRPLYTAKENSVGIESLKISTINFAWYRDISKLDGVSPAIEYLIFIKSKVF